MTKKKNDTCDLFNEANSVDIDAVSLNDDVQCMFLFDEIFYLLSDSYFLDYPGEEYAKRASAEVASFDDADNGSNIFNDIINEIAMCQNDNGSILNAELSNSIYRLL